MIIKGLFLFLFLLPLLCSAVPLNKFCLNVPKPVDQHHNIVHTTRHTGGFFRRYFGHFFFPKQIHGADDDTDQQQQKQDSLSDAATSDVDANANAGKKGRHGKVKGRLSEGFYSDTCPQAEKIVKEITNKSFKKDPGDAASIIRLMAHDCLVMGCDASLLLDVTPSGEEVEKNAKHNERYMSGYRIIDQIKARLEAECPETVSCADIIAFTSRDSLVFTGVPDYPVKGGRRDALESLAKNVEGNLAYPYTPANQIIAMFHKKGFSLEELILLVGAHSVGNAHCNTISDLFWNPKKNKDMDPGFVRKMKSQTICENESQVVAIDPYSNHKMDSRFYNELLKNRAVIESDHNLAKVPEARKIMEKYVNDHDGWMKDFVKAVTKLQDLHPKTGNQGEIRKQCRVVNNQAR